MKQGAGGSPRSQDRAGFGPSLPQGIEFPAGLSVPWRIPKGEADGAGGPAIGRRDEDINAETAKLEIEANKLKAEADKLEAEAWRLQLSVPMDVGKSGLAVFAAVIAALKTAESLGGL